MVKYDVAALVWTADKEARLLYANTALLHWLGCGYRDIAMHRWVDGVHPDDIHRVTCTAHRSFAANVELLLYCRLRHHSGQWRWIVTVGHPWGRALYRGLFTELTE